MPAHEKNEKALLIIYKLLETKYSYLSDHELRVLDERRNALNDELEQIDRNNKVHENNSSHNVESSESRILIIQGKINDIDRQTGEINKKSAETKTILKNKFQAMLRDDDFEEHSNNFNIEGYLKSNPDFCNNSQVSLDDEDNQIKDLLIDFNSGSGKFEPYNTDDELKKTLSCINKIIEEIMDFCSEKNPGFQFDSEIVRELNGILNKLSSQEKSLEANGSAQEILKELTEQMLTGVVKHVKQTSTRQLQNLLDPNPAPYVHEHQKLSEIICTLMTHQHLVESQKLYFIKEELNEYAKQHHVEECIKMDPFKFEDIPRHLDAVLEGRKRMFEKKTREAQEAEKIKQQQKENSIGSFNDKINNALHDSAKKKLHRNKQDDFSKSVLKNICEKLLAVCLEANEELKTLGLPNKNDKETDQAYCERVATDLSNKAENSAHFADQLKKVNLLRKNDKHVAQFRQLGIFYSDYRQQIQLTAMTASTIAVCLGLRTAYKKNEVAIQEMLLGLHGVATRTMQFANQFANQSARDASEQMRAILNTSVKLVAYKEIGEPLVKKIGQLGHQTISYFFPKPEEKKTSSSPDSTISQESSSELKNKDTSGSLSTSFRKRSSASLSPFKIQDDLDYTDDIGSSTPDSKQNKNGRPSPSPSPSPVYQDEDETPKATK